MMRDLLVFLLSAQILSEKTTSRVALGLHVRKLLIGVYQYNHGPDFIESLKQKILLNNICYAEMGRIPVTNCTCDIVV